MGEVIANGPAAGDKARAGLTKEESARFFGPPPLIAGEDQAQYEAMRDQISAAVGPLDFLEEIWVNDVVNLVWETLRLRRLRAALVHISTHRRLLEMLKSPEPATARKLITDWALRAPDAVADVDAALAGGGKTIDEVTAEIFALKIDEIERIDRMVAGAEARRNVDLREIDRHRATLGAAVRQRADEVLDAEFKELPPRLSEGEPA